MPIIATTIINSIRVKPFCSDFMRNSCGDGWTTAHGSCRVAKGESNRRAKGGSALQLIVFNWYIVDQGGFRAWAVSGFADTIGRRASETDAARHSIPSFLTL